jgi:molybdopterin-binding protein
MNTLSARVTTIDSSKHLCALGVTVFTDPFDLILVETPSFSQGDSVTLVFKETEVILQKSALQMSSANTQKGRIESIESGIVLTSVTLTYHKTTIISLITTNAYKRLALTIGDEVIWMVQPSEISLLRGHDGV